MAKTGTAKTDTAKNHEKTEILTLQRHKARDGFEIITRGHGRERAG